MTRLTLLPVLFVLLLGTLTAPASAGAVTRAEAYAASAHEATNKQRVSNGLGTLRTNRCLQRFALRQAARMAATRTLGHQDLSPVLTACDLRAAGENVAYGYATGRSVVNAGWMPSEAHRTNLLATGFRMEGIGAVRGPGGRWWVAQVFGTRR